MLHFISFKIIHRFGYFAVKLDANEALKETWHKRFSVTLICSRTCTRVCLSPHDIVFCYKKNHKFCSILSFYDRRKQDDFLVHLQPPKPCYTPFLSRPFTNFYKYHIDYTTFILTWMNSLSGPVEGHQVLRPFNRAIDAYAREISLEALI